MWLPWPIVLTISFCVALVPPAAHAQLQALKKAGATRAVVVGISEYQDKSIGDLRFAHRDAEAFAAYLQSELGGGMGEEHMILLTNEKATGARFAEALQWLINESQDSDRAIIYFSGHGDVGKTITRPEYLLLHDASSVSYLTGGVMEVLKLQEIITTLSVSKNVLVTVIADACRSGKLEERQLPGVSLFGEQLAQQKANEIKILSCKADELSREGEQWGGGRGVFSYYLLDALSGMADTNKDDVITAQELRDYLEYKVVSDIAPARQTPVIVAPRLKATIAFLTDAHHTYMSSRQTNQIQRFYIATTKTKKEELLLTGTDPTIQTAYQSFYAALQEKKFSSPKDSSAELYYQHLISCDLLEPIHGDITRDYAVSLQDDAQILINYILSSDLNHIGISHKKRKDYYRQIPNLLEQAIRLLKPDHIMYQDLKERKLLFETLYWYNTIKNIDQDSTQDTLLHNLHLLTTKHTFAPIAHFYLSRYYLEHVMLPDSAIYHAEMALHHKPEWILPLTNTGFNLARYANDLKRSRDLLSRAQEIDAENLHVWHGLGGYYNYAGQYDSMIVAYRYILTKDSTNALIWSTLGVALMTTSTLAESEMALAKALAIDSTMSATHYYLGCLHQLKKDYVAAEQCHLRSLALHPGRLHVLDSLGHIYILQGKYADAQSIYRQIKNNNPNHRLADAYLASLALRQNQIESAKSLLTMWVENNKDHHIDICENSYLSILCGTPEMQSLLTRH